LRGSRCAHVQRLELIPRRHSSITGAGDVSEQEGGRWQDLLRKSNRG
jgi:hypothetical protein